jgi:hypothetical protein
VSDLIQRLRDWDTGDDHTGQKLLMEAADELEHISSVLVDKDREIERLQAALCELPRMLAESERFQRERDEARDMFRMATEETGYRMAERDRLRAALTDLEDEVRILLRDNDVEVTEGMSCAIDIARDALAGKARE